MVDWRFSYFNGSALARTPSRTTLRTRTIGFFAALFFDRFALARTGSRGTTRMHTVGVVPAFFSGAFAFVLVI